MIDPSDDELSLNEDFDDLEEYPMTGMPLYERYLELRRDLEDLLLQLDTYTNDRESLAVENPQVLEEKFMNERARKLDEAVGYSIQLREILEEHLVEAHENVEQLRAAGNVEELEKLLQELSSKLEYLQRETYQFMTRLDDIIQGEEYEATLFLKQVAEASKILTAAFSIYLRKRKVPREKHARLIAEFLNDERLEDIIDIVNRPEIWRDVFDAYVPSNT